MTKFLNGPAAGKLLVLRFAPDFLRVTRRSDGEFDALDSPSDVAEDGETIFVYAKASQDSSGFLDYTDKRGRRQGVQFTGATYRYLEAQPEDAVARDNGKWEAWCRSHIKERKP